MKSPATRMMSTFFNLYARLNPCLVETMNYQHHFHAGNHADVLKHLVLLQLIELMQQKPTGFLLLETHAGAGLYDLQASEARRSDEASGGIGRLLQACKRPKPVAAMKHQAVSGDSCRPHKPPVRCPI